MYELWNIAVSWINLHLTSMHFNVLVFFFCSCQTHFPERSGKVRAKYAPHTNVYSQHFGGEVSRPLPMSRGPNTCFINTKMLISLRDWNQRRVSECQAAVNGRGRRCFSPQDGRLEAASSDRWKSDSDSSGRYASNRPAGVSAKGNNQKATLLCKRPAGQIHSLHCSSLIAHKCLTAWFILKEQSGLYVTGLSARTQMLLFFL